MCKDLFIQYLLNLLQIMSMEAEETQDCLRDSPLAEDEETAEMAEEEAEEETERNELFPEITERTLTSQSKSGKSSKSGSSRHSAASLSINPFGFEARTTFCATDSLSQNRSLSFEPQVQEKDDNIWKRPPPDFRPQCYAPNPPKRNSREAVKPWMYRSESDERYRDYVKRKKERVALPHILRGRHSDHGKFVTRFTIPGPYEAKLMFTKEGMYKPGPYVMPKPHDFRGYPSIASLGLPEFETNYEHDPFNLNFNSERLNIYHGINLEPPTDRHIRGRQMAPPKTPEPKYDAKLILSKDPWPNKHHEYTRHKRLNRSPHSALMERIETTLSAQWARQKLQPTLTKANTHL